MLFTGGANLTLWQNKKCQREKQDYFDWTAHQLFMGVVCEVWALIYQHLHTSHQEKESYDSRKEIF